MSEGVAGGSSL